MKAIAGLNLEELEQLLSPLPRFRASQIQKWIIKGAAGFDEMTNIPAAMQKELSQRFSIFSSVISCCHEDGQTKKIVLSLEDGAQIEAVLLSDGKKRLTACLSTQAGCPAGCVFCKTGSIGFKRNLESYEIAEQFLHLQALIKNNSRRKEEEKTQNVIDNIVIMGMGEPFLNLDNLRKAISVLTCPKGINLSRRRITVSTCGIYNGLADFAKNGPFVRLALSLTTADEPLRGKLMPVTKTNPLKKIKETLLLFQNNGGGRITLELPLLGGINTRDIDAKSIADFSAGLDCVVNIIPWNPVAGLSFEGKQLREPDKKEITDFIRILESYNLKVTTHSPRFFQGLKNSSKL